MPEYLTPGVYFETVDVGPPGIAAIRTDIAAFVGIAERGPLHAPARVHSWEQFHAAFGGFIPNGYLAYAVKAFFENGGRTCYVVRVAAPAVRTDADPAADPQPADRSASIVLSVDGFVAGAVATLSQGDTLRINHLIRDVNHAGRRLTWERPFEAEFDLGQPLRVETGAAAASGILLDENGVPTLRVEAASPGAWGNRLAVRVTRSHRAATRMRNAAQPSDGSSSLVESVAGFEVGALVKVFQEQTPAPLVEHRIVKAVDPSRRRIVSDVPLDPAVYDLAHPDSRPIAFETIEFGLTVYLDGRVHETLSGLSLVDRISGRENERYAVGAIERGSNLIRVVDLHSASPLPERLPDPQAVSLRRGPLNLRGGRDGIAALQVSDFTGDLGSTQKWGLRTLEEVDEVAIVAMPDILIQPARAVEFAPQPAPEPDVCLPSDEALSIPELPAPRLVERAPGFTPDEVFRAQQALVGHCEMQRDRIAILDPPTPSQPADFVELEEIQTWRLRFDSKYAALTFPWVLVYDPLRLPGQIVRAIPPSGHVAGIYARTDNEAGVHKAPANEELRWAQGATLDVTAEMQALLNPAGINCIRIFPGRGLRLYGARTVSSDALWRYVNVRRLMMMIEEAVEESIQWAVFEPNDFYLRQKVRLAISSFLERLWERGALVGAAAGEAFFVKCDEENNPPAIADLGQLIALVGVAPVRPAEFVVFRIGRTEDELDIAELEGSQPWR